MAHLERLSVEVELGVGGAVRRPGAGTSVYFREPDGALLEFISCT